MNKPMNDNTETEPKFVTYAKKAEDLLAFHEGSYEKKTPGGHYVVWINETDFKTILSSIRASITLAQQ